MKEKETKMFNESWNVKLNDWERGNDAYCELKWDELNDRE
jgi:hypothetical protein